MIQSDINFERVQEAIEYLTQNFQQQPLLAEVAEQVNVSPQHFQRIFTEWAGVSPKRFLQFITVDFLKKKLHETANMAEATDWAGLSSVSRIHDLFVKLEGVTPQAYKQAGWGLHIQYGYHQTPFGKCFIAVAERGICWLSFVDELTESADFELFTKKWHFATLEENHKATASYISQIFDTTQQPINRIHLLVQGTNFQVKVWEALLKIPQGAVGTYQQIAQAIGSPDAVRAVGTAIGSNPIAYLIPCHRVIRKEGKLGEYRWGATRKKAIIGWEMGKNQ
jgi:AraC family transcriptional regulator, regulatory protein of adaptative response / methylated-DNA-[protein]-cysteine methyltransferase